MKKRVLLTAALAALLLLAIPQSVFAHQMANSYVVLNVHDTNVTADLEIPTAELGQAIGVDLATVPDEALVTHEQQIKTYLSDHIRPSTDNRAWVVSVGTLGVQDTTDDQVGDYTSLVTVATLTPPPGVSTHALTFAYDAVVREERAHIILVSVKEDWTDGIVTKQSTKDAGVIQVDATNDTIAPLNINVDENQLWDDFLAMIGLGMTHIREGTDHLLFLLTLLLPATLIAVNGRWRKPSGTKRSLINILKIATAFTIGHSITLVICTLLRPDMPSWPIEVLIAVSIMVSAIHAFRPIFAGKEVWIAAGFGLVHGMAFSFTLAELDLTTSQLVVSLVGFNIGIELMQLFIIAVTIPSLIFLSTTKAYTGIRIGGAALAFVAAFGWIIERIGYPNAISYVANAFSAYAVWMIVALAVTSLAIYIKRFYYSGGESVKDEHVRKGM